jgi:hypothetical protein
MTRQKTYDKPLKIVAATKSAGYKLIAAFEILKGP